MSEGESPPSFRTLLLSRLNERNANLRAKERLFRNYAHMVDELAKARGNQHQRTRGQSDNSCSEQASSEEVRRLRDEIAEVLRLKCKNDQDLIDANRRLAENDGSISKITEERDRLLLEMKKLCARAAELEHKLKKAEGDRDLVKDELLALRLQESSSTTKIRELEEDRLNLINKVRELNERHAELFNSEISRFDNSRQIQDQARIQEEIAKALADTSRDDRTAALINDVNGPMCYGDTVPLTAESRFECGELELTDVRWLSGDVVATAGADRKVRIWRVDNNRPTKTATLTGANLAVTRLDFDQETRCLLASSNDKVVRLWNIDNSRLVTSLSGHTDRVSAARFQMNGHFAVSGSDDRSIKYWDIRSVRTITTYFPGSKILDMGGSVTTMGDVFVSGHFDKSVRVWDRRSAEPVRQISLGGKVTSLDVGSDGRMILCCSRDDTLSLIDVRTFDIVHIYSAEQYRTSSDLARCVLSPGMEYCAAGSSDGHVFVWNVQTTRLEKVLQRGGHDHAVLSLHWNPTGRGIMSVDKQKMAVLWQ